MTLMTGKDWPPDGKKGAYDETTQTSDETTQTSDEFEYQQGKPIKALIGIVLLVVLALVLSRLNPAPHETSSNPAVTTGQTTGSATR